MQGKDPPLMRSALEGLIFYSTMTVHTGWIPMFRGMHLLMDTTRPMSMDGFLRCFTEHGFTIWRLGNSYVDGQLPLFPMLDRFGTAETGPASTAS
jgi:hypothetical protein